MAPALWAMMTVMDPTLAETHSRDSTLPISPGDTFRMYARNAEEAVAEIRDKFGADGQVVSVRAVRMPGINGIWGRTRLELIVRRKPVEPVKRAPADPAAFAPMPEVGPDTTSTETGPLGTAGTVEPSLERMLLRAGLSDSIVERLRALPDWEELCGGPLHVGLGRVTAGIRRISSLRAPRALPSVAAFVGPAGSGRTTALCKWMSDEVLAWTRSGSVCSVEFDRAQGAETLNLFCEILGVEFGRSPGGPRDAPGTDGFVFYDLPPLSITAGAANNRIRAYLDANGIPGRVLVVSALTETPLLRRFFATGADAGCTHVVFTHLDELPTWGKLWNFLVDGPLDPLFLGTGSALTGERETDVIGALLKRTFPIN